MSQTTQFVSFPLSEGIHSVAMSATAWGAGVVKNDGDIKLAVGPDCIGARNVRRKVAVQPASQTHPKGYKNAGTFKVGRKKLRVLVEFPAD